MRIMTPVHDDKELNNAWLETRGFVLGATYWYNAIRDGSGRYDGYCITPSLYPGQFFVRTVDEALDAMRYGRAAPQPEPSPDERPSLGDMPAIKEIMDKAVDDLMAAEDRAWENQVRAVSDLMADEAQKLIDVKVDSTYDDKTKTINMNIKISRKEI
jgi:hypothetical protein